MTVYMVHFLLRLLVMIFRQKTKQNKTKPNPPTKKQKKQNLSPFFFLPECRSLNSRLLHPQTSKMSKLFLKSDLSVSQASLEASMFFSGGHFTVRTMNHLYPCGLPACPGVCFKSIIFHLSISFSSSWAWKPGPLSC